MVIVSCCVLSCTEPMNGDKPTYCMNIFHILQDVGNLNVTVFTHHRDYDRQRYLQFVHEAFNRHWWVKLVINKRYDIMYRHWKVYQLLASSFNLVFYAIVSG